MSIVRLGPIHIPVSGGVEMRRRVGRVGAAEHGANGGQLRSSKVGRSLCDDSAERLNAQIRSQAISQANLSGESLERSNPLLLARQRPDRASGRSTVGQGERA